MQITVLSQHGQFLLPVFNFVALQESQSESKHLEDKEKTAKPSTTKSKRLETKQ